MDKPIFKTLKNSALIRNEEEQIYDEFQRRKTKNKSRVKLPGTRTGKWSNQQNEKYLHFLINNREEMNIKGYRRQNKIFMQMEKEIGTRCSQQCRSHHQKVEYEAKSQQVDAVISFLIVKLQKQFQYDSLLKKLSKQPKIETKQRQEAVNDPEKCQQTDKGLLIKVNFEQMEQW